jgi:hypothetical protein
VIKKEGDRIVFKKTIESAGSKNSSSRTVAAEMTARKMVGAEFTFTVDFRTRKVTEVKGVGDHLKKAFAKDEDLYRMMTTMINEESVKQEMESILTDFLPDADVRAGSSWKRQMNSSMGPTGSLDIESTYTYRGKEKLDDKSLDKIEGSWTTTYVPPKKTEGAPFVVKKGELKTDQATGSYFFDATSGRLVQSERKLRIHGTLLINASGSDVKMDIEQEQVQKVSISDKSPKEK